MAYPQFALMTLQLIAPSNNMTLQEYKDAYGIDLTATDIHAFKLVLSDGQKYAIDQIKAIEDGYEIYFNGRILSITDIVQTSDEVYDVVNAKPIYFHGLELVKGAGNASIFYGHILNNSPEPIDTIAKLNAWFTSFDGAIYFTGNGAITLPDIGFVQVFSIYKRANENTLNVVYMAESGYSVEFNVSLSAIFTGITDGVNKIN